MFGGNVGVDDSDATTGADGGLKVENVRQELIRRHMIAEICTTIDEALLSMIKNHIYNFEI